MAYSSGAYNRSESSPREVNLTSNSIFTNLLFVGLAAGIVWTAIGFVIL